jgi:surface polysaccharide O-acyltransferase-like enzyme
MTTSITKARIIPETIYGFDYLRAMGCIMVLLIHSGALNVLTINSKMQSISRVLYFDFLMLAVPVFLNISLFLFLYNRKKSKHYFWSNRLPKLLNLYCFWVALKLVFKLIVDKSNLVFFGTIQSTILTVISGGYSELYFIFSLIFMTTLTEFSVRFTSRFNSRYQMSITYCLFAIFCLFIAILPAIALHTQNHLITEWWSPLNFLPYGFAAAIVLGDFQLGISQQSVKLKLIALLCLYLIFAVLEWKYLNYPEFFGLELPQYSRLSLVFGSSILMYLALMVDNQPNEWVRQLSDNSAGIYFTHRFIVNKYSINLLAPHLGLGLNNLAIFVLGLSTSFMISLLLRRVKVLRAFV